jgi:hypothetical protein
MPKDGSPNMRCISFILYLISAASLSAADYKPWFPPPFEFHGKIECLYENAQKVESSQGGFREDLDFASLRGGLNVTIWPRWNVEAELYLTHAEKIGFQYEASLLSLRYAWLDDIESDFCTLVTGVTCSFPGTPFLHNFSFPYHGYVNIEFHTTLGKEWTVHHDWLYRGFILGGFGIANRGSPWAHGLLSFEVKPCVCFWGGIFAEGIFGLGDHDIVPNLPFNGYASIGHQSIDIGAHLDYDCCYLGILIFKGWYNIYARNYIENYWGVSLSLLIPFSIL